MKKLTRRDALEKMRDMWMWIAEETKKRKKRVYKDDYFEAIGATKDDIPENMCYACEYAKNMNTNCCIIEKWKLSLKGCAEQEFGKWCDAKTWKQSAKYAREIAEVAQAELDKLEG